MRLHIKIFCFFGVLLFGFFLNAKIARGLSIIHVDQVIHFSPNSAVIREVSIPILQDVGALLRANPTMQVVIEGHTDTFESKRNPLDLAQRRAQATKDFLVNLGIDSSRLTIAGYGSARPVAGNDKEEDRAKNRRVEFNSFSPPSVFEGIRDVPVADLENKFEKERDKKSSAGFMILARLNQVAYARRAVSLPVETWNGKDYYPWYWGDPADERLSSAQNPQKDASGRLKKAIRYFSEVIHSPPERHILGLHNYPAERKLNAYRGLIWCLWQMGEKEKASKLYPKYLEAAKAMDQHDESYLLSAWQMLLPVVGPDSELQPSFKKIELIGSDDLLKKWDSIGDRSDSSLLEKKADLLLNLSLKNSKQVFVQYYPNSSLPVVKGFVSDDKTQDPAFKEILKQRLDEAIALYEKVSNLLQVKSSGGYPESTDDGRVRIKHKLVRALAQIQSKEQALASYQTLLEEKLALDQRLNQFPNAESDNSLQVWWEMQAYLDPQKDTVYIQETEQRLKNAKLKAYR